MKRFYKTFSAIASLALLATGFMACSHDDGETIYVKPNVTVTPAIIVSGFTTNTLAASATEELVAILSGTDSLEVAWKSEGEAATATPDAENAKKCTVTASATETGTFKVWAENSEGTIKSNVITYYVGTDAPEPEHELGEEVLITTANTTVSLGEDKSSTVGGSITLTATLNEVVTEKVTYKWYKDNTEISGATEKTYTVTVTEGESTYKVEVTGSESNVSIEGTVKITGKAEISGKIEAVFADSKCSNDFFTVKGSYKADASATSDGTTYTGCLKLESSAGTVEFTITKTMTLTLVVGSGGPSIKIAKDGGTAEKVTGTASVITKSLDAGSYKLSKADSKQLFYISLE
ncbi:MAG: hypothetical protein IJ158_12660 [Treponema sp.]|nr:hypothetical protein [Treponema sp.]